MTRIGGRGSTRIRRSCLPIRVDPRPPIRVIRGPDLKGSDMPRPVLAVLAGLALAAPAAADTLDRGKLDRIDPAVEKAIAAGRCPGAVVAVVHRDEVVFRKAYGL